jgi:hypothetical protein
MSRYIERGTALGAGLWSWVEIEVDGQRAQLSRGAASKTDGGRWRVCKQWPGSLQLHDADEGSARRYKEERWSERGRGREVECPRRLL